jgi:hypothetical protein
LARLREHQQQPLSACIATSVLVQRRRKAMFSCAFSQQENLQQTNVVNVNKEDGENKMDKEIR